MIRRIVGWAVLVGAGLFAVGFVTTHGPVGTWDWLQTAGVDVYRWVAAAAPHHGGPIPPIHPTRP